MKIPLLLLFFSGILFAEPPNIGVINVETIFSSYNAVIESKKDFQAQQEKVAKGTRFETLKSADETLRELAEQVRNTELSNKDRELAAQKFNSLSIEYQSLISDFDEYIAIERRKINLMQLERMEMLLAEIRAEVELVSREKDFDLVLETGGITSSQVSPIVYLRSGTDITQLVLARLNEKSTVPPADKDS